VDWQYESFAGVFSTFKPSVHYSQPVEWEIASPYEGDNFIVLSTGDMGQDSDREYAYATIWQEAIFNPGDTLSFAWFFGTTDYTPYNDWASAKLIPVDPADNLAEINLMQVSVNEIGSFLCTDGWQVTEFSFDETNAGRYNLAFKVQEVGDLIYETYFAVDAITVVPEPASLLLLGLGGLALLKRRQR
jgi:hypothetical protein